MNIQYCIGIVVVLCFFLSCQKKDEILVNSGEQKTSIIKVEESEKSKNVASVTGYTYSKKYHTYVYTFRNGSVVGLQSNDEDGDLFFDSSNGMHTVIETGALWRYQLEYSAINDVVWVLFSNVDESRVFKISDNGIVTDEMRFIPTTFPDSAKLVLSDGKPVRIEFSTIEGTSTYVVDAEKHTINLVQAGVYDYNGEKP